VKAKPETEYGPWTMGNAGEIGRMVTTYTSSPIVPGEWMPLTTWEPAHLTEGRQARGGDVRGPNGERLGDELGPKEPAHKRDHPLVVIAVALALYAVVLGIVALALEVS
jgi:hypothetical protein